MSPADKKHSRRYGKSSPLDRLPEPVRAELRRRCQVGETFREMRAWLLAEDHCRTSLDSLSRWWRRQQTAVQAFVAGSFEIVVAAPGASEVRVQVRSLPTSETTVPA